MKCPVCKTECDGVSACPTCGFNQINQTFINRDDAERWYQEVVLPFKSNYEKSNVLAPIDWVELFKKNAQAKHLFDFSIPVAIKRRTDLDLHKTPGDEDYLEYLKDATLEHIAIVSSSDVVRKHFLEVIEELYLQTVGFKRTASMAVERASDLAAILSNLVGGEALIFEINSKIKKDVVKVFSTALDGCFLDITIGKGPGARNVRLDLPSFTTVFVAERISDIPAEIAGTLSAIIEVNPEKNELDELQIREIAPLYDVQLTKSTIEVIKEFNSQNVLKNIKSILKFISDYLYLHPEIQQPLSEDALRNILKTIS